MRWIGMATATLFLAACGASFADPLVVPNSQATAPGNLAVSVGASPSRFQEIVGGGQFNGPYAAPIVITGFHVRSAPGTGPVNYTYPSITITLSTTQAYPNTNNGHTLPSTTFAANLGPDATTVYSGPFTASSPGCSNPGPCPFDIGITFSTPFPFSVVNGRLLIDIVQSAASGTPTGNLDGVQFPDSSSSTVAFVAGDPTQPAGSVSLAGLVFELDTGSAVLTPLSGSFCVVLNANNINSAAAGFAVLAVMNLDGAGNSSGSYTSISGGNNTQAPQTSTGTFTGTYSTNLDGTGSISLNLDIGLALTFDIVITNGGHNLQLAMISCAGCNINGIEISAFARAAYPGSLNGNYGLQLTNSPFPLQTIGVAKFDGAGNLTVSVIKVGVGGATGQPPLSGGSVSGTYSINPDGSGTMSLPIPGGALTFAFVITDSGSGLLLLETDASNGSSVSFGTAQLQ